MQRELLIGAGECRIKCCKRYEVAITAARGVSQVPQPRHWVAAQSTLNLSTPGQAA